MNVEDVRGFLAVVDQGRVGAAADELGISQSALTRLGLTAIRGHVVGLPSV